MRPHKNNNASVQHRIKQETQLVHCFGYFTWKLSAARTISGNSRTSEGNFGGNSRVEIKEG